MRIDLHAFVRALPEDLPLWDIVDRVRRATGFEFHDPGVPALSHSVSEIMDALACAGFQGHMGRVKTYADSANRAEYITTSLWRRG
jgi:hypothetical protein